MKVTMIYNLEFANQHDHLLPEGFSCRLYQEGDQGYWEQINKIAGGHKSINKGLFEKEFQERRDLHRRQFYVLHGKDPVATATAWFTNGWGRVHWLAVLPDYQKRGLGEYLLQTVISQIGSEHLLPKIYLKTHHDRIAALNFYWKHGFRPKIVKKVDLRVWGKIGTFL